MADFEYWTLKEKYRDFEVPSAIVKVNGKDFSENRDGLALTDLDVELTAGFEAAIASFRIYNAFDAESSKYVFKKVKPYILLGSSVVICMGYCGVFEPVFCGYIARVNFMQEEKGAPCIRVTAMDIKGIMMAGSYAGQIKAASYGEAVEEILKKTAFRKLRERGIITDVQVTRTPDYRPLGEEGRKESAETIEMVSESDYEFVVKAAKKFNYEFFTDVGMVYFRRAKADPSVLLEIGPGTGLHTMDVEYDMTGLVQQLEVKSMNVDKAKVISAKKKYKDKISKGKYAKALLQDSRKVYIDTTADSAETAGHRVQSLLGSMSYRFGSLNCEIIGLPELAPGRFIKLDHIGSPVENLFYLTKVRHVLSGEKGFYTMLEGRARKL